MQILLLSAFVSLNSFEHCPEPGPRFSSESEISTGLLVARVPQVVGIRHSKLANELCFRLHK